jgi:hypothetical protein
LGIPCTEDFLFLAFFIIILEMNSVKHFFSNLDLLSRFNPSGVTYEGVSSPDVTQGTGACPIATLTGMVPRT